MSLDRPVAPKPDRTLLDDYDRIRNTTADLAADLTDADATVQSMEDASPAKWHLAHTTWFFETFVLSPKVKGYELFDERFGFLFNSYYEAIGERQPRPRRGMLTRPTLQQVNDYRAHVDAAMTALLDDNVNNDLAATVTLGLHHEQQHQELFLTDILHLFAQNPLRPAFKSPEPLAVSPTEPPEHSWTRYDVGTRTFGYDGTGFSFDCEGPSHNAIIGTFELASRPVTNAEWLSFMEDDGYRTATLWLSDGWTTVKEEGWDAPGYWQRRDDSWWSMSLRGMQPVDLAAPVTHISYFEADAFASWSNARLPTEYELEWAVQDEEIEGNFADSGRLRPAPASASSNRPIQLYGDVWEWTRSPFTPYPGFQPPDGAVGEYNGKFMNGQYVLRGGSCATPAGHVRATYRNFFQPEKRWQFSGLRLARDI
ncbi:MAG: ergothioneine biosynthesis protein EgtB [Pseudomonadota bacterium]